MERKINSTYAKYQILKIQNKVVAKIIHFTVFEKTCSQTVEFGRQIIILP